MALVHADRVKETSTTTGTGTYTLAGAVADFQSFAVIGNANTCYYVAFEAGVGWEVGIGTYTAAGTTLARTTILASSNAGAAVSWPAGTRAIWVGVPAGKFLGSDAIEAALDAKQQWFGDVITPTALPGSTVDDYAPAGGDAATVWRLEGSTGAAISGIAGGSEGRVIIIESLSADSSITLLDENIGSVAANRFKLDGDTAIGQNTTTVLRYDGTLARWRVMTWTPRLVAQSDAESGTGTQKRVWSSERVAQAIAAQAVRLAVEDQVISGGARVTVKDLGNLSGVTITPDPGDRPIQKITNDGAGTIAPGANVGCYLLVVKNTTGAGAITTSGWQDVSGEAFDTTTTSEFLCHCTVVGDFSAMVINKVA